MVIFKISEELNEQELEIVKETLLSLNINWQETMIIDEYLYHRYIQLVSDKIENFSEIGKIKSDIKITGIAMKQPPKITTKDVLDILLQFIKEQREFNNQIIQRFDKLVELNNLKE